MKNFIHRTISEESKVFDEDGNIVKVSAMRTRTSAGYSAISVEFGKQRIDFTIGDSYEEHARLVIDILGRICDNPCLLPSEKTDVESK